MDSNGNKPKPSLAFGLSLIEKAQELRWTLQLATAILFADLLLAWRTGTGIVDWSLQADHLLANSGFLLVSVLGYGVLMSVVMPLAAAIFWELGWQLLIAIPWPSWMQSEPDYSRPRGCVLPSELSEYAYKKEDRTLLDIVATHQEHKQKSTAEKLAAGQRIFSVLALGLLNYFPEILGVHAETLLKEVPDTFGRFGELAITSALFMGVFAIKTMWFSNDQPQWIDYPPLYDYLEKARRTQGFIKTHRH